jgi:hypothetical protein
MRIFLVSLFAAATSAAALCSPGGILENVKTIQVEPTIVEQPEKVKDASAANLVRYNLRAAVRDANFQEGDSPIKAHIVLDEFSREGKVKRLTVDLGSGGSTTTVDGRLVIQDASGKELANVRIHLHGSVAFRSTQPNGAQGRLGTSDLEQLLIQEIERLK